MSFVDVPGHERFVRNMLAGAGGIEAVLLVVAADESVMPQTREHFEIVRMLGLTRGVVAVTKSDRVAPELVAVTVSDVRELLQGSALAAAPDRPGLVRDRRGARRAARPRCSRSRGNRQAEEREARVTRLPIDRAFLVPGFGPVVTGSLVSGAITRDQKLEILPGRRPVRVRRLEVHGREEQVARAGERVSANLAGVELEDLHRGMVLTRPGALPSSARLLVRLELLSGASPLKSGARVAFHHFASEARAGVRVLASGSVAPGQSALVELRLSREVAAIPGDRFVVRRLSPVETIGGGVVLDPQPPAQRGRLTAEALSALEPLESPDLADATDPLGRAEPRPRRLGRGPGAARRSRCRLRARRPRAGPCRGPAPRPAALARSLPERGGPGRDREPGRETPAGADFRERRRRGRLAGNVAAAAASRLRFALGRGGGSGARLARRRGRRRRGGAPAGQERAGRPGTRAVGKDRRALSAGGSEPARPPWKSRRRSAATSRWSKA